MGLNAKIYRIFILNELTTFVFNHWIEKNDDTSKYRTKFSDWYGLNFKWDSSLFFFCCFQIEKAHLRVKNASTEKK